MAQCEALQKSEMDMDAAQFSAVIGRNNRLRHPAHWSQQKNESGILIIGTQAQRT